MANKVYITGASGRLGRVILSKCDAIPIVRKKSGLKDEILSDFSIANLEKILKDADAIIHLAGSRDFLDQKKAWEGNVELSRKIVEASPRTAKIIFSSSISVYGKKLARIPADEKTELHPDTPYAKTKIEAEKLVEKHPNHAILRIGPIYGPGFEEYFKILRLIEKGKMKIIGDGKNRIPFVQVDDVADAIINSIEKGIGKYVLVGECKAQKEIFEIAANELGVEAPAKHTSVFLAKIFAQYELFRSTHFGGSAKFIPEDIAVLSSDRAFNCSKARQEIGFSPISIKKGISQMVQRYRKRIKS
ncbi:MAG: NAD(P)-dependent oxidoreductase [Candidatus Micrarchaeota archaeon]|nr:NAD(P)-dependent oxidoreductase [Candidatus Micrarchaeota archaeon]